MSILDSVVAFSGVCPVVVLDEDLGVCLAMFGVVFLVLFFNEALFAPQVSFFSFF